MSGFTHPCPGITWCVCDLPASYMWPVGLCSTTEAPPLCSVVTEKEGGLSTVLQATENGNKATAAAVHPQLLCSGNECSLDPHVRHTPQPEL